VMECVSVSMVSMMVVGNHQSHDRCRQPLEDSMCSLCTEMMAPLILRRIARTHGDVLSSLTLELVARVTPNYCFDPPASVVEDSSRIELMDNQTKARPHRM
jgi:hypothetical protein